MRLLLPLLLLGTFACGEGLQGPQQRLRSFTDCVAPAGVIRVEDHVGGTAARYAYFAKVVVPKRAAEAFVQSCGFTIEDLDREFSMANRNPIEAQDFWDPPRSEPTAGAEHRGARPKAMLFFERDTDVVVYLHSTGSFE